MDVPAGFVEDDVRAVVSQYAVRTLRQQHAQADLVAHGAGEHEQSGLLACELGNLRLEIRRVGVLAEDVVVERAFGDGSQHGWCRGRPNITFVSLAG